MKTGLVQARKLNFTPRCSINERLHFEASISGPGGSQRLHFMKHVTVFDQCLLPETGSSVGETDVFKNT